MRLSGHTLVAAERWVRAGLSFLVGIPLARYLGPDQFGQFSYAIGLANLCYVASVFGSDRVLTKEIAQAAAEPSPYLFTALVIRLLLFISLFSGALGWLWGTGKPMELIKLCALFGLGCIIATTTVLDAHFYARLQTPRLALAYFANALTDSAIKIGLILVSASLLYFSAAFIGAWFVWALIAVAFYARNHPLRWDWSTAFGKRLLTQGLPLVVSSLLLPAMATLDQLMLAQYFDMATVAGYTIGLKIAEVVNYVGLAAALAMFPRVVNARHANSSKYHSELQNLYDRSVVLCLLPVAPLVIFAEDIVVILFGPEYGVAAGALRIYACSSLFFVLLIANDKFFLLTNSLACSLLTAVLALVFKCVGNAVLLPKYGINGAALATAIALVLAITAVLATLRPARPLLGYIARALNLFANLKRMLSRI